MSKWSDNPENLEKGRSLAALEKSREILIKTLERQEISVETWKFQCSLEFDPLRLISQESDPEK